MKALRFLAFFVTLGAVGCTANPPPKPPTGSPEKVKSEADLAFTSISKKAYVSLDIKTHAAAVTDVNERLSLTGWIMAKPGNEVTLTAPVAGYVRFVNGHAPIAGETVAKKDPLLQLEPVLSPVEKIQVAALERSTKSDLIKAQANLKNAALELTRTEGLFKVQGRSQQDLELAQKMVNLAQEEEAAAAEKLTFFKIQKENIPLQTPRAGKILQLHASEGQYVPVAAPLVTIIDLDPIWIRVPVPEYDYLSVDPKAEIDITLKNGNQTGIAPFLKAKPAGRVAQIDPLKHTADFWYELLPSNEAGRFVKDQMVAALLPIGKKEKGTVIPYSALIFDAHGHAWIYVERTTDKDTKHIFERRPVELVSAADKNDVVIRTNLVSGDRIVINGAAALFSRDFHKTPVLGEDD